MPELAKAELRQLNADFKKEVEPNVRVKVQFNPETLKVSFANQVASPSGGGDQNGSPAQVFVGAGTTKLSVQLWFDVTAEQLEGEEQVDDVRKLTQKIAQFITPQEDPKDKKKFIPPAVRFVWGSFQFDGVMESLDESLEFFSAEGKPLRASVSFGLTQQKITKFVFANENPAGTGEEDPPGTRPLTQAPEGSTVQSLAAQQGKGSDWQGIAAANKVENPRKVPPGQLLDMNRSQPLR